jgi:hypothetical protein
MKLSTIFIAIASLLRRSRRRRQLSISTLFARRIRRSDTRSHWPRPLSFRPPSWTMIPAGCHAVTRTAIAAASTTDLS